MNILSHFEKSLQTHNLEKAISHYLIEGNSYSNNKKLVLEILKTYSHCFRKGKIISWFSITSFGSSAVEGKRFLESNASSVRGTYFRLG